MSEQNADIVAIPKYPDALKIAGRLFRLGLKDYDYGIYPDRVDLTREGIDRLLMWAEQGLLNDGEA
jgi:hypothetical protein